MISRLLKAPIKTLGNSYVRLLLKREFESQHADERGPNERSLEYRFALEALALTRHQDAIDIGTGTSPWPALLRTCGYHVTAIDEVKQYWDGAGMMNRHFLVLDGDITQPEPFGAQKFGIVTCISTLEHIKAHAQAMRGMSKMLKPHGILVLTVPYNETGEYIPNVYDHPDAGYGKGNPYICQVFNRQNVEEWQFLTGLRILRQDYFRCFTGKLWTMGTRLNPMQQAAAHETHQLTGIVLSPR